ncbi:stage II sporulation protein M [Bacillus fungorum]|uniref:Stage II sporulation protein M n=1 Tax=Bacillus fungorum TaxID=2039284 RepID=A0A2G6Q5W2_9BACI|nr:stage II sporulation protein M [Bacillus fungorum]PIE92135.1 hypothetical protein CO726_28150 [Bacillus fungorum]
MISLINFRKILNKTVVCILAVYTILFMSVYCFIAFGNPEVQKIDNQELIQYVNWQDIFIHNISSAFTFIFLGLLSFGVISTIFFLYDFYLISYAAYSAYVHSGSFLYSFAVLMTHGFVEIIGIALNFYLSTMSFRYLINKLYKRNIFYVEDFKSIIQIMFLMLIIFLIASLIEGFITPNLLKIIVE